MIRSSPTSSTFWIFCCNKLLFNSALGSRMLGEKEEKNSVDWLEQIANQNVDTMVSLHYLHPSRRPQLDAEGDLGDSHIELPCWQKGNTRSFTQTLQLQVGRSDLCKLPMMTWGLLMLVELLEKLSASSWFFWVDRIPSRWRSRPSNWDQQLVISYTVTRHTMGYLQGCLAVDDDWTLDIVAR